MNAQERKALKRALTSQENWKEKARKRKKLIRLQELKIRDLERSRRQWKEKFYLKIERNEDNTKEAKTPQVKPDKQVSVKKN